MNIRHDFYGFGNDSINKISLIFDRPDGIIYDLMYNLEFHSFQCNPKELDVNRVCLQINDLDDLQKLKNDYEMEVSSKMKDSKLVIFVATTDSVNSERCKRLLQLSKQLDLPIISLIVEEIPNLDEITDITDHRFEVYKDRLYKDSYDYYMWYGECFQRFIYHCHAMLGNKKTVCEASEFSLSFSLTNKIAANSIKNILKIFEATKNVFNLMQDFISLNGFDFECDLNEKNKYAIVESSVETYDQVFDFNEYILKRADIDERIDDYLAIVRIFDNVIQNAEFFKNKDLFEENAEAGFNRNSQKERVYIYIRLNSILGVRYKADNRIESFLNEEMKKYDIELDVLNHALMFLLIRNPNKYEDFVTNKTVIFLLNKDYYESKRFQKLYFEAKRMKKEIFLVKIEDFELTIDVVDGYDRMHVHDISKHADCDYKGYLTRRFLANVEEYCSTGIRELKYGLFYDVFIFSYAKRFIERVIDLKNIFRNQNIRIKCKTDESQSDDVYDDIEKSKIVIFCLTNDYLKSNEFKNELNFAKKNEKHVLFLLMEEIQEPVDDYNEYDSFEIYKNDPSSLFKGEVFYKFCYFLYSLLDFQQNRVSYDGEEVHLQPIDKYEDKKSLNYDPLKKNRSLKEQRKIALYNDSSFFRVKKLTVKMTVKIKSEDIKVIVHIEHLKRFCILRKNHSDLFFTDNSGKIIKKFTHQYSASNSFQYKVLFYDKQRKSLYLNYEYQNKSYVDIYDENMNFKCKVSFKVYIDDFIIQNNQVYMFGRDFGVDSRHGKKRLLILDLDLNIKREICLPEHFVDMYQKTTNIIESRCNNYIYIAGLREQVIKAFNINSFKFNENMHLCFNMDFKLYENLKGNNLKVFEEQKNKTVFYNYEIEFNKHENAIDRKLSRYVCQLNSYPPHLLKHPYVLPCGSFACLECIYENYNLYLQKFICAACGNNEHQRLENQLVKSNLIDENLESISETQLGHLKKDLKYYLTIQGKHENLDNLFKFLEEDIEIRVESIKVKIDEQAEAQIKCIDRLEQKLIKKALKSKRKKKKNEYDISCLFKYLKNSPYKEISDKIKDNEDIPFGSLIFDRFNSV